MEKIIVLGVALWAFVRLILWVFEKDIILKAVWEYIKPIIWMSKKDTMFKDIWEYFCVEIEKESKILDDQNDSRYRYHQLYLSLKKRGEEGTLPKKGTPEWLKLYDYCVEIDTKYSVLVRHSVPTTSNAMLLKNMTKEKGE